ncbi:MAG: class I SAM-dependent methyltransferase [Planctomycetales bacterium]|nr:class I SAM-dependent methyltransferase [Planctomycetales bacterium]
MTVEDDYDRWAATYDEATNVTRDLDHVATRAALGGSRYENALEIGCGTGKNTQWLAPLCRRLTAVDLSSEMLAIAQQKVRDPHVTWRQFDITRPWALEVQSHDLVTFNLVLEHVADLSEVISFAARSLARGGRLYLSELHPYKQYLGSKARYQLGGQVQTLETFTHHVGDYVTAVVNAGLRLERLAEKFDDESPAIPRLLTLLAKAT